MSISSLFQPDEEEKKLKVSTRFDALSCEDAAEQTRHVGIRRVTLRGSTRCNMCRVGRWLTILIGSFVVLLGEISKCPESKCENSQHISALLSDIPEVVEIPNCQGNTSEIIKDGCPLSDVAVAHRCNNNPSLRSLDLLLYKFPDECVRCAIAASH